jgi:hypothetical protein
MTSLTKKYLINGPYNVVRLTNEDKVIYIFGETHIKNTSCEYNDNFDSIDIDKLLFKFMKTEKKKEFDIFIETNNNLQHFYKQKYNNPSYLGELRKLYKFNKYIDYNNNTIINKNYSNFRFHFFDIRNFLEYRIHEYVYNTNYDWYNLYELNMLINKFIDFENYLKNFEDILYKNTFIQKLLNKYENEKIKVIINKLFNELVIKNIKNIKERINAFIKNTKKYIEKYKKIYNEFPVTNSEIKLFRKKITIKMEEILDSFMNIEIVLCDLFLIRRILDKNYVKNSIVYTGGFHLIDITYILVNYFNFKIENSFKPINNLIIKKYNLVNFEYLEKLEKYFMIIDDDLDFNQCVNLFNFPDNFL